LTPLIVFHGAETIVTPVNADRLIASHRGRPGPWRGGSPATTSNGGDNPGRPHRRLCQVDGTVVAEQWIVHGGSHAWFGGNPVGSYTDAQGPDASAEMLQFSASAPVTVH
jgi:hypothetical protein